MTSAAASRIKDPEGCHRLSITQLEAESTSEVRLRRSKEASRMLWLLNAAIAMVMLMSATATATPAKTARRSSGPAIETVPVQLNPNVLVPSRPFRPLHNDSISPWTYNDSHDVSVFPPVSEARCLLRGCLDSDGVEDLTLKSAPILHQVLLLHRLKSGGKEPGYHYRLEPRLIAVGCTCVRDPVRRQGQ
uniref:interleukin 17a/f1 n=1 Tax=Doryrhamphus excisus TaxID=161450 RepID=UPI0025AE4672|nr:interleukin 17a/f1 [Doryrhamphus excisus]